MIEITDDLLDAAETAYVDAIDLGVTNKHIATKILEAVIPLISEQAVAAERKFLVEAMEGVASLLAEGMQNGRYPQAEYDSAEALAVAVANRIRARGASCA